MVDFIKLYLLVGMSCLAIVLAERTTFAEKLADARKLHTLSRVSEVVCILIVWVLLWPTLIPAFIGGLFEGHRRRKR